MVADTKTMTTTDDGLSDEKTGEREEGYGLVGLLDRGCFYFEPILNDLIGGSENAQLVCFRISLPSSWSQSGLVFHTNMLDVHLGCFTNVVDLV